MALPTRFTADGTPPWFTYRSLSIFLGLVTLATFGTERLLSEIVGLSLGDFPAYVLSGVVLVVGTGSFAAALHGRAIATAVLLALGPVGGLAVYLLGYHLVLPPSSDSPTSLLFLAFAGGFLALGVVTHVVGRAVTTVV